MERGFSSFRSIPTWLTLIASFTVGSILGYFIIQRRNRIHQDTFAENSDNQPKIRKVDENTTIHSKSENKERENNQTGKEQRTEEKTEQSAVPPTIVERKEAVLEEEPMPPILKFKNNATEKALIIDYGTTTLRSGPVAYSPSYDAPNIVGHPKGRNSKKYWSEFRKGNEAFDNRKLGEGLQIVQPVHGGVIQDFDASEFIWNELLSNGLSYYDLEGFSDLSVLMTASPASRNRICEILFEEYSVGKLLLVSQDFLALADSQTWTGLSVHLGSENSSVVPIYNGCAIESARKQFSVCGKTLTEYVSERVAWDTQRHAIGRMDDFIKYKISNSLKCNFTCVPDEFGFFNDRKNEFLSTISNRANNPTENILDNQLLVGLVNDNVSKAGDALFYDENNSLQQVIFRALQSCDSALHERLLGNVVVHGGTAALPGLKSRLELELETIASRNNIHYPVNVMIQEKPHQAAWRGACNLSTLTSFPDMFITGELFHEEGHAVCRSYFMS